MRYNKNSGYGQIVGQLPFTGSGKVFAVGDSGTVNRDMLQDLFDVDVDGVVRFFADVDSAIGACTANAGDVIFVMPGHTETISAASGITCDVAGVSIIGLGNGSDKPVFTFGTSNAASVVVSADNVKILNIRGLAAIDGLTKPFDVTGDQCSFDVEWWDGSSTVEAATVFKLNGANNFDLKYKHLGYTNGDASVKPVSVIGCSNGKIDIDGYGLVSTSWVNFNTTASSNISVRGRLYTQGITDFSRDVVDTVSGSKWDAVLFDASFGGNVSGGSAAALASDDVSALNTATGTVFSITKVVTQSAIVSGGLDLSGVSSGTLQVVDMYVQNGSTAADSVGHGATMIAYTNNSFGSGSFWTAAQAKLSANANVGGFNATTWTSGTILETGKKFSIKAIGEDFTTAGTMKVTLILRRLSDGATIAAA
ncbi:MAG: hypothetical protein RI965_350 [Bacteroidota bacterium]|jgi:hypothetical protein